MLKTHINTRSQLDGNTCVERLENTRAPKDTLNNTWAHCGVNWAGRQLQHRGGKLLGGDGALGVDNAEGARSLARKTGRAPHRCACGNMSNNGACQGSIDDRFAK